MTSPTKSPISAHGHRPRRLPLLPAVAATALCLLAESHGGSLFYAPIPAIGSDAGSSIDANNTYTSAVNCGRSATRTINGVTFTPLAISGNQASANNITLSAATGVLAGGGGKTATLQADGTMAEILSAYTFNQDADNGSEQYIVIDPASLQAGKTYDLRIYIGNSGSQDRLTDLSFAGDGQPAVETDLFNEDDATTSPGGFKDPNQAYYIDYRYTWDGTTTPGVTITQRAGSVPFAFYALTNEEVSSQAGLPPAAVAEAPAPQLPAPQLQTPQLHALETIQTDIRDDDAADETQTDVGVASDIFYSAESLHRHGQWVDVANYGRCWEPRGVAADWRPYTVGRWHYASNAGWAFDSDEEWGWATYHYGRWACVSGNRWVWAPGRVWAPAWCSWRYGGGHVGWAPLPPDAGFDRRVGIGGWADAHYGLGPASYNFCNVSDFGAANVGAILFPRRENVNYIQQSVNVTNISRVTNISNNNTTIFNGGPNIHAVNNVIRNSGGQPFAPILVSRTAAAQPFAGGKYHQMNGNVLSFAAPKVTPGANKATLPKVAETIPASKLDKGWSQVDPKQAEALKTHIAQQAHGLTPANAPATIPLSLANKGFKPTIQPPTLHPGTAPGMAIVKPGQPLTADQKAAPGTQAPKGIQRPGEHPGLSGIKPGQPVVPGEHVAPRPSEARIPGLPGTKPGQPLTPAEHGVNPREPHNPAATIPKPGQPLNPAEHEVTPREPHNPAGTIPKPGQPLNPAEHEVTPREPHNPAAIIPKPGQPLNPAEHEVTPREPHNPAATVPKPGQPLNPAQHEVTPREPHNPAATIPKPGQPLNPSEHEVTPREPHNPAATVPKPGQPLNEHEIVRPNEPRNVEPVEPSRPVEPRQPAEPRVNHESVKPVPFEGHAPAVQEKHREKPAEPRKPAEPQAQNRQPVRPREASVAEKPTAPRPEPAKIAERPQPSHAEVKPNAAPAKKKGDEKDKEKKD